MTTLFSEMKKTLEGRWRTEWSRDLQLMPVSRAFRRSLQAATTVQVKAKEVRATGKYSEQGLAEELRKLAAQIAVPVLKESARDLEAFATDLAKQKNALTIPPADPNNAAQAIVRSEMRAWMRTLPRAQVMAALIAADADERMLQAAFEAPAIMSGLTEDMRKQVLKDVTERKYGPEISKVADLEEALAQASSAVQISLYQMRQDVLFKKEDDAGFNKWMKAVTIDVEVDEATQPPEETISNISDRIDEVFARAFPKLYPDHPANQPLAS